MAKHIPAYTLSGLLLLSASCSQEEMTRKGNENSTGRIEFRAVLPQLSSRATSRATEITTDLLDNFQVSSLMAGESSITPHFLDKTFSRNAETGTYFSLDPECIWPNNSDVLTFVAFSPSCGEMRQAGGFGAEDFVLTDFATADADSENADADSENADADSENATGYKLSAFKVVPDIASQVDFVTAIGSGNLYDNEETPIDINFRHQLSRIRVKAWGNSQSYNLEIAGVRLGGVATEGTFNFMKQVAAGDSQAEEAGVSAPAYCWENVGKGSVEYIYRAGDVVAVLDKSGNSPTSAAKAVTVMGSKVGEGDGYENSAMIIPSNNPEWNYKDNPENGEGNSEGMYICVLVRITDITPYAPGSIVYPYGVDEGGIADSSLGMEVIYLAVDKTDGKTVKTRVYVNEGEYFTDEECSEAYDPEANGAVVKAYGWASLPVAVDWKPGYEYTYTLNYTNGVGLRNPADSKPGQPIISDRVLVNVEMSKWAETENSDVLVPRR